MENKTHLRWSPYAHILVSNESDESIDSKKKNIIKSNSNSNNSNGSVGKFNTRSDLIRTSYSLPLTTSNSDDEDNDEDDNDDIKNDNDDDDDDDVGSDNSNWSQSSQSKEESDRLISEYKKLFKNQPTPSPSTSPLNSNIGNIKRSTNFIYNVLMKKMKMKMKMTMMKMKRMKIMVKNFVQKF